MKPGVGLAAVFLSCSACGEPAVGPDADAGSDVSADVSADARPACGARDCRLDCDPNDTWLALSASSAGSPALRSLGDSDPASPQEVGDGRYHLFVGVSNETMSVGSSCGGAGQSFVVLIHDAISTAPDTGYAITATPIFAYAPLPAPYDFDRYGMETPAYLRADAHTEYVYYCGLYASYDCGAKGKLAALRRTDGGAWERVLADVAPYYAGSASQCEPDVVWDAAAGLYRLFFIADLGAGGTPGLFERTSKSPELFDASTEKLVAPVAARPAVAWDPFDGVWRFSTNVYNADDIHQSWAGSLDPTTLPADLVANDGILHQSLHDLHPSLHDNASASVSQPSSPIFPAPDEVIYFYSGYTGSGSSAVLQVLGQRCTRRP
jgi:hypothetical protein